MIQRVVATFQIIIKIRITKDIRHLINGHLMVAKNMYQITLMHLKKPISTLKFKLLETEIVMDNLMVITRLVERNFSKVKLILWHL